MSSAYLKFKMFYLILVILFSLGVLAYLLDSWGVIRLEDHLPFLASDPPVVSADSDSPTELEREWLEKETERLREEEVTLLAERAELDRLKEELKKKEEDLLAREKGLEEEQARFEVRKEEEERRESMVGDMASRLGAMPPDDAVAIVAGWSNPDLVDVFLRMEADAAEQGAPSIVPFLITKLPRERAAIITTLMMDEEARKLPVP